MDRDLFNVLKSGGHLPDPRTLDISDLVHETLHEYLDSVQVMLTELEHTALDLETGANIPDNVTGIRRMLHTLKGKSGLSGLGDIHNLCHEAESVFDEFPDVTLAADIILKVKDWISAALDYLATLENGVSAHVEARGPEDNPPCLCVDDDRVTQTLIKMVMKPWFRFDVASSGRQGVDMYLESVRRGAPYRLLTLDYNMPDLNGIQTLNTIRSEEKSRGISLPNSVKIILITGCDTDDPMFKILRPGHEAVLAKDKVKNNIREVLTSLKLLPADATR